jgi:ribosomal protein S18 acetylase RimI-like enzyme
MLRVRQLTKGDRAWAAALLRREWGAARQVSRGRIYHPESLPGIVAERDGERVGLLTCCFEDDELQVVTINSLVEGIGVGTALLERAREAALACGARRLWLITTNDNTHALRFFQRRGFRIAAVRPGAVDEARSALKPEIPLTGRDGIPIRDEIELELPLGER